MPDVEFVNLLAVSVVALLAPLTLGLAPALRVRPSCSRSSPA